MDYNTIPTGIEIGIIIISLLVTYFVAVPVHELGHLVGGKISGYKLFFLSVFGFGIARNENGWHFVKSRIRGQCLMYAEDEKRDPKLLVTGGALMTALAGAVCGILVSAVSSKRFALVLFGCAAGFFASTLCNLVSRNPYSDGKQLSELKSFSNNVIYYNRYMQIYEAAMRGIPLKDMDANWFSGLRVSDRSTLSADMALLKYYRDMETVPVQRWAYDLFFEKDIYDMREKEILWAIDIERMIKKAATGNRIPGCQSIRVIGEKAAMKCWTDDASRELVRTLSKETDDPRAMLLLSLLEYGSMYGITDTGRKMIEKNTQGLFSGFWKTARSTMEAAMTELKRIERAS